MASIARDDPFPLPGMHRDPMHFRHRETDRRTDRRTLYILHLALKTIKNGISAKAVLKEASLLSIVERICRIGEI